jgi:Uma2 family endonuclease
MGGVTVTESPPVRPLTIFDRTEQGTPWTFSDLGKLPEGYRYEIFDGSLLVSPPPPVPHGRTTTDLDRILDRAAPAHLYVSAAGIGVSIKGGASYLVPDIVVIRRSALDQRRETLLPPDVLLVVEVLSPSNRGSDLVLKRHEYAVAGIPQYWLVDQSTRTLTILRLDEKTGHYAEAAVVRAGEVWKTDDPYALALDPADFV